MITGRLGSCKGCGEPIIWIKTSTGKIMPCNPEQVVYWEKKKGDGKVVTPNGEVLSCEFSGEQELATGIGYIPHWGNCPGAERFRKART